MMKPFNIFFLLRGCLSVLVLLGGVMLVHGPAQGGSIYERLKTTKACPSCDLSQTDFNNADLVKADLRRAVLWGAGL